MLVLFSQTIIQKYCDRKILALILFVLHSCLQQEGPNDREDSLNLDYYFKLDIAEIFVLV